MVTCSRMIEPLVSLNPTASKRADGIRPAEVSRGHRNTHVRTVDTPLSHEAEPALICPAEARNDVYSSRNCPTTFRERKLPQLDLLNQSTE